MSVTTIDDWVELFASNTDNSKKIINNISTICNSRNSFQRYCGKLFVYNFLIQDMNIEPYLQLYNSGILCSYIPEFKNIHVIQQNKQYGKNLLEHSFLTSVAMDYVVDEFEKRFDFEDFWIDISYDSLKFSALLHDIGKKYDVEKHHIISSDVSKNICHEFEDIACDNFVDHVSLICLNHMYPFGYQRGEQWSDNAILKFAERCGSIELGLATIIISACDKYASTRKTHYLDPLFHLCERLCNLTHEF